MQPTYEEIQAVIERARIYEAGFWTNTQESIYDTLRVLIEIVELLNERLNHVDN